MSDTWFIGQQDGSGPLCPHETTSPLHAAQTAVLNRFYEATERDGGEFRNPAVETAYMAAAYPKNSHGMNLYWADAIADHGPHGRGGTTVEAWYFKCPVCFFVLPAVSTAR